MCCGLVKFVTIPCISVPVIIFERGYQAKSVQLPAVFSEGMLVLPVVMIAQGR